MPRISVRPGLRPASTPRLGAFPAPRPPEQVPKVPFQPPPRPRPPGADLLCLGVPPFLCSWNRASSGRGPQMASNGWPCLRPAVLTGTAVRGSPGCTPAPSPQNAEQRPVVRRGARGSSPVAADGRLDCSQPGPIVGPAAGPLCACLCGHTFPPLARGAGPAGGAGCCGPGWKAAPVSQGPGRLGFPPVTCGGPAPPPRRGRPAGPFMCAAPAGVSRHLIVARFASPSPLTMLSNFSCAY